MIYPVRWRKEVKGFIHMHHVDDQQWRQCIWDCLETMKRATQPDARTTTGADSDDPPIHNAELLLGVGAASA